MDSIREKGPREVLIKYIKEYIKQAMGVNATI